MHSRRMDQRLYSFPKAVRKAQLRRPHSGNGLFINRKCWGHEVQSPLLSRQCQQSHALLLLRGVSLSAPPTSSQLGAFPYLVRTRFVFLVSSHPSSLLSMGVEEHEKSRKRRETDGIHITIHTNAILEAEADGVRKKTRVRPTEAETMFPAPE